MLAQNAPQTSDQPGDFPQSAKKSPRPRILVVDDDRLLRWALTETLTARGCDVSEAPDANAAMEAIGFGPRCDRVLLDFRLPDARDLKLLAHIRETTPATPVILMTAFGTRELAEQIAALGATFVSKPFDLNDFAAGIERTLASRVY